MPNSTPSLASDPGERTNPVSTARQEAEPEVQRLLSAVKEEKDMLASLLASVGDEVWFADTNKKFTLANASALREFGLDPAKGIGVEQLAAGLEVLRPDGSPRPIEEAPPLRALRGETVRDLEEMVRTPASGELRYRQVSSAPVRDPRGAIIGSVSVVRDITERKRAEAALQDNARLLNDIIDGCSPSAIFLKDRDGKFITINAPLEKMLGMSRGALKGKTDYDLFPKEVADLYRANDMQVMATGKAIQVEEAADLPDGRHFFLANKFPLVDAEGRLYGIGAISHDITERQRTEEALRLSEERYRLLYDKNPDGVFVVDATGRFVVANPACEVISGYSNAELLQKSFMDLCAPDQLARTIEYFKRGVRERSSQQLETVLVRKDGRRVEVWITGAPIASDAKTLSVHCTARDITERKRMEAEVRRGAEELRATNEELAQFNQAMVGRELRMIELKQEIDELCARLGQPPRYGTQMDQPAPPAE